MFYNPTLNAPIDKRPKSSPFHGEVTGSNPVGSTICRYGGMVDTLVLGTSIERCAGSSPVAGTRYPFTLSVEAMSFTFIPRFNYPELPNNSLRLCRICRSVGMVDKEVSKTFAETRVGSSPIFGTKGAHSNISFEEYLKFIG